MAFDKKSYQKKYEEKNKIRLKEKRRIWYSKHTEERIKKVKQWKLDHPVSVKIYQQRYYEKNKSDIRKKTSSYQKQCPERRKIQVEKIRMEVLSHYSEGKFKCHLCTEKRIECLTIDHIDGGGNRHRVKLFGHKNYGGTIFYYWLRRNDYPRGYRVLCMNCQVFTARRLQIQERKNIERILKPTESE